MAKKENRVVVTMACTDCKSRNYVTSKNRQQKKGKEQARLELSKYCNVCRKHVTHREAK
jgi:large subunit ribosomal protein L33